MKNRLSVYLQDHLAGADLAIKLLEDLRAHCSTTGAEALPASLHIRIREDRATLQKLVDAVGAGRALLKEAASWVGEKATLIKLGEQEDEFGHFEALEFLALGVLGKKQLWRALRELPKSHFEMNSINFDELIARADAQYALIETRRLGLVTLALGQPDEAT